MKGIHKQVVIKVNCLRDVKEEGNLNVTGLRIQRSQGNFRGIIVVEQVSVKVTLYSFYF